MWEERSVGGEECGRKGRALYRGRARPTALGEDADDDAPVLRPALTRVVGAHGFVFSVTDDVHLMEGDLMRFVQVPFYGFGARFAQVLIHDLVAACVGVSFDLDEVAARVGLQLRDHLVDAHARGFGQLG